MIFPLEIVGASHALDLGVAVAIGFAFGFVLERAGFGCAPKLAAQFYGTDMTVLKVMFTAIATAALGSAVLSGFGVLDLGAVARAATSSFRLWPMLAGGLLLGVGFVVSGYCPGTSLVAAASGKLDGAVAALGVVAGTMLYGAAMGSDAFAEFARSGDLGRRSLPELLALRPAAVAVLVALVAVGCFAVAEKVERALGGREGVPGSRGARRVAFAVIGALAVASLATLTRPGVSAAGVAPTTFAAPSPPAGREHRAAAPDSTATRRERDAEGGCP